MRQVKVFSNKALGFIDERVRVKEGEMVYFTICKRFNSNFLSQEALISGKKSIFYGIL